MRTVFLAAGAVAALALSGCATITKGSGQSVTVLTDPNGAQCKLDRSGMTLAIVNPTPGSVQVEKSKDTITIRCSKEGFLETAGTLDSEVQGMTFGNILFGGIIGVAVDASSGAMNQYPSSVTLLLVPESFTSTTARDVFFDGASARAKALTAESIAKITGECTDGEGCTSKVAQAKSAGDARLAQIELQRQQAQIRP